MKEEIKFLISKAKRSLKTAQRLCEDGDYDFSVSRAYYAMFYMVEALLLTKGLKFSKHKGVISSFGKEFVKTGIFDSEYHRYLISAFEERQTSDYDYSAEISKETAQEILEIAQEFSKKTLEFLKSQGHYEEG